MKRYIAAAAFAWCVGSAPTGCQMNKVLENVKENPEITAKCAGETEAAEGCKTCCTGNGGSGYLWHDGECKCL